MTAAPHLWLALSPHGYGHATMTAPLVAELRRRWPGMRLTIQTALPREFLATRYQNFSYVGEIPDFGFRMLSAMSIDLPASVAGYQALHADLGAVIEREAARLRAAAPDLVLANVPYVTIAAAARAGIPVAGYSSLNWADMADHYFGHLPACDRLRAEIRACYAQADVFLRPRPAQVMTLPNIRDIGPVVRLGTNRRREICDRLGLDSEVRLGLIAFGGIDHRLPLESWQRVEGWFWLSSLLDTPERPDMASWQAAGIPFADLSVSVDLMVGKPGYGTFSEAGVAGVPVLYEPRPDWPEAPELECWLAQHTKCLPVSAQQMLDDDLNLLLHKLFSMPEQRVAVPTGVGEGADILAGMVNERAQPANAVDGGDDHDAGVSNGGGE